MLVFLQVTDIVNFLVFCKKKMLQCASATDMLFLYYIPIDCLEHKLVKYMLPASDKRA